MPKYSLDKIPPGRKRGVLKERTRGPKARRYDDRCESVRGQIELIPREFWEELAANKFHKERRRRYRWTFDQDGLGSCAPESGYGGKGACDMRQGLPMVFTNPLFAYYTTSGGRDNGSVIGDNVEHLRDYGACPEEVWPRSKGFRAEPSSQAYKIAAFFKLKEFFYIETIDEFVSGLLQGYDIHAGYDGHAVIFDRYLGGQKVEFKNSWGAWGDDGFGPLPLSKIYFPYGAYAYKLVVPYATPAADRGWDWKSPWQPKYDQAKLAEAVRRYNEETMIHRVTAGRSPAWREDTYARALESCGLAI
jgi:hypothetical protein